MNKTTKKVEIATTTKIALQNDKKGPGLLGTIILLGVLVFIIALLIGAAVNNPFLKSDSNDNQIAPVPDAPTYKTFGQKFTLGNFEYTFNDYVIVKSLGTEYFSKTADGVFLVVNFTVENVGKKSEYLSNNNIKVVDEQDREFSDDTGAGFYLSMLGKQYELFLFEQMQPGLPKSGWIVFDLPTNINPHLEVEDSSIWSSKKEIVVFPKKESIPTQASPSPDVNVPTNVSSQSSPQTNNKTTTRVELPLCVSASGCSLALGDLPTGYVFDKNSSRSVSLSEYSAEEQQELTLAGWKERYFSMFVLANQTDSDFMPYAYSGRASIYKTVDGAKKMFAKGKADTENDSNLTVYSQSKVGFDSIAYYYSENIDGTAFKTNCVSFNYSNMNNTICAGGLPDATDNTEAYYRALSLELRLKKDLGLPKYQEITTDNPPVSNADYCAGFKEQCDKYSECEGYQMMQDQGLC